MPEEGEVFENTKGVIIIFISKKNRQHNDQKKKYKTTHNHLQNTRGTYPWLLVRHIFHSSQPSHSGDHTTFEVMTSSYP